MGQNVKGKKGLKKIPEFPAVGCRYRCVKACTVCSLELRFGQLEVA